jgi:hypothetical protein
MISSFVLFLEKELNYIEYRILRMISFNIILTRMISFFGEEDGYIDIVIKKKEKRKETEYTSPLLVRIPPKLHDRFRDYCIRTFQTTHSQSWVITMALTMYLDSQAQAGKTHTQSETQMKHPKQKKVYDAITILLQNGVRDTVSSLQIAGYLTNAGILDKRTHRNRELAMIALGFLTEPVIVKGIHHGRNIVYTTYRTDMNAIPKELLSVVGEKVEVPEPNQEETVK